MPLDKALMHTVLSHPCPSCGHRMEQEGKWFWSRPTPYRCPECDALVPMKYPDKIKLFDRHARPKKA